MDKQSDDSHSGERVRFAYFLTEYSYDAAAIIIELPDLEIECSSKNL